MDPKVCDEIRSRLRRYGDAVRETKEHASERSCFGRYRAGAPYFEQYPLRELLVSGNGCDPAFLEGARDRYDRITRELSGPLLGGSRAYREELCRDLQTCVELYRTSICCNELGMDGFKETAYPSLRDEIGLLIGELGDDFPLADLICEVNALDAASRAISETGMAGSTGTSAPASGQNAAAESPYKRRGPGTGRGTLGSFTRSAGGRIRLMEITQKITVATRIHAIFKRNSGSGDGIVTIRRSETRCVSGRNAMAMNWNAAGSTERGKKVPEKSIMGVMSRNAG